MRSFALSFVAFAAVLPVIGAGVGQPNYYGPIDPRGFPQPDVIYPQPMIVQPPPAGTIRQPMYLRVPEGHTKNWPKHCAKYRACAEPVYFVAERWYDEVYAPRFDPGRRSRR